MRENTQTMTLNATIDPPGPHFPPQSTSVIKKRASGAAYQLGDIRSIRDHRSVLTNSKYNFKIVFVKFDEILSLEEGPGRTAALVAWLQGLFEDEDATPVLVGGAAVELYTLGAYTTGDVDLVGSVTPSVAQLLKESGFKRHGRHWLHEPAQIFVEFPASVLDPGERAWRIEVAGREVHIISAEDLLIDRLGSWEYWQSSVDGVNALLLWSAQKQNMDIERLENRVVQTGWKTAWQSLLQFAARWEQRKPPAEEIEKWANEGP
jgi:hypothetical protein